MSHILVIAPMPVNRERRGPAIRSWELACVLSSEHDVTLLVPNPDHPVHPNFQVKTCSGDNASGATFDALLAKQEIVVIQGPALQTYPRLAEILAAGQHYLVVDLYDPITLESLAMDRSRPICQWLHLEQTGLINQQLELGDFFLCATERQRDYWLGALSALGRLNHDTWDGNDFRRLIDLVPFGLPAEPPSSLARPVLKGIFPGVAPTDKVIIWGGGLWDWLDPLTPIRAMKRVAAREPKARLIFFQLAAGWTAMSDRARQLAAELGLLDRQVLFAPWLPPEQWTACLLEADVGLSFHPAGIETHFAFRTRLLDYIWAGLPIVTAKGDVLSELVAARDLGHVLVPGDVEGLADALLSLLEEPDARGSRQKAFSQVAAQLTWEQAAKPLTDYCSRPWRAGDAGPTFTRRWLAAEHDRLVSEAAHAARWRLEAEAYARALQDYGSKVTEELQRSEERFQATIEGRVLRLMATIRLWWRRLGRGAP